MHTQLNSLQLHEINQRFTAEHFSLKECDRISYSRDLWPIIPFGAGSGVCGGTFPARGGIILDLKKMSRLIKINRLDMSATIECGKIGQHLEEELNRAGFTMGHFPSSIYCSTLGGYLASRSAGQFSSRYGKIEDMVLDFRFISPGQRPIDTALMESGANSLNQVLLGSEGTLGIFSQARLRIYPYTSNFLWRGFSFKDILQGIEALKRIFQSGLRPTVARLYDPFDSLLNKLHSEDEPSKQPGKKLGYTFDPLLEEALNLVTRKTINKLLGQPKLLNHLASKLPSGCRLVLGFENRGAIDFEAASHCFNLLRSMGGKDLGESPGKYWLQHRYKVAYKQSKIFDAAAFVDTMEVAATWDNLLPMYQQVRKVIAPYAFIMAHFSHAYQEGCSIYFTFAVADRGKDESLSHYQKIWREGLSSVISCGGTISHHHGLGKLKQDFVHQEMGNFFPYFQKIKQTFDPLGIMNPEKLGLL